MATKSKKTEIDALITYIFLKKLMCPIINMPAFKKGLIDSAGRVLKEPITKQEEESLTLLDKIVLKMKRLLGPRVASLYQFIYLQSLSNQLYQNIIIMGSPTSRSEIQRITKDIKRLQEENNINNEDMINLLLEEEIKSSKEDQVMS
jgi:hypothetical protein